MTGAGASGEPKERRATMTGAGASGEPKERRATMTGAGASGEPKERRATMTGADASGDGSRDCRVAVICDYLICAEGGLDVRSEGGAGPGRPWFWD